MALLLACPLEDQERQLSACDPFLPPPLRTLVPLPHRLEEAEELAGSADDGKAGGGKRPFSAGVQPATAGRAGKGTRPASANAGGAGTQAMLHRKGLGADAGAGGSMRRSDPGSASKRLADVFLDEGLQVSGQVLR